MSEKIKVTNTEIDIIDIDISIKKDFYKLTKGDYPTEILEHRLNSLETNLNKLYYVKKLLKTFFLNFYFIKRVYIIYFVLINFYISKFGIELIAVTLFSLIRLE